MPLQTLVEVDTLGHSTAGALYHVFIEFRLKGAHGGRVQGALLGENSTGRGHHETEAKTAKTLISNQRVCMQRESLTSSPQGAFGMAH